MPDHTSGANFTLVLNNLGGGDYMLMQITSSISIVGSL